MNIVRTLGIGGIALLLLATATSARPQSPQKVFRVGYLANTPPVAELEAGTSSHPGVVLFLEGMRDLGWHDGKNMHVVWKSAEGQYDRLPRLADELVRMPVDVIVAFGGGVTAAARATKTIPIVMATYYSPVEAGLAESYARPGGNVTGLTLRAGNTDQHNEKRLALLKEASPRISRVAFVTRAPAAFAHRVAETLRGSSAAASATKLGLELFAVTFPDPSGLKAAIQGAVKQGAQGLWFDDIPELYYPEHQEVIAEEARRHRVPVMHQVLSAAAHGALMSYGTDITINYRRVPYYVDRILKGVKPGDIPIEQPSRVEFHVNLKAARSIGLTIPPALLVQADRVIE